MHTLEDHAKAKTELDALNAKWDNYSGNNPNKYRANIEAARAQLHIIETELKANGILPRTLVEERDALLDSTFPNAQSQDVVIWQGKKYKRHFSPISQSLSGKTVYAWKKQWREISSEATA